LFARAAFCDVTPRDRPLYLAGYSSRNSPVSTVLDPIEVSAILLESSGSRCLIFSFDLMMVGSELQSAIRTRLKPLGFEPDQIVLLASHTHTAPATDQACKSIGLPDLRFVDDLTDATEDLVRQILDKLPSPVRLEVFQGQLHHSINRRRYRPFPSISRMHGLRWSSTGFAPNPSGPKDERVTIVVLRKTDDDKALAAVWHYSCHPTAVAPIDAISSDYPGTVRMTLREVLGQIPCAFVQGFCGNIRPNISPAPRRIGLRERLIRFVRAVAFGNMFPEVSHADWLRWSRDLAAGVRAIVAGHPTGSFVARGIRTGSANIPVDHFFEGSAPDKPLAVQIVGIGEELEIAALSAEASVEWQGILDAAVPVPSGCIRLYSGYLGAVFGYLPTAAQVAEGGYEVEGFQLFFGLSGHFDATRICSAVVSCVKSAFEEINRSGAPSESPRT